MIKFCLAFLFAANFVYSQPQLNEADNKTLKLLLKERKERFEKYTDHLDDKSGFFGNQNKKDIKNINEVLKEIVRTDNKIILELDRLMDQTRYETKSYEFENKKASEDLVKLELEKEKYLAAIDTLNKQVEFYKAQAANKKSGSSNKWIIISLLIIGGSILFYNRYKKKKVNEQ